MYMRNYKLKCKRCGTVITANGITPPEHCPDSLLVSDYDERRFSVKDISGIWKFNWLPVNSPEFYQPGPVVYKSEGLARKLGLNNLYIAFNGYWPEQGVEISTCTFKEYEAAAVLENACANNIKGMVVASAGNTARAFAHLSTVSSIPVIIVVPRMCLYEMWYLEASLKIPTLVLEQGDYSNAIDLAKRIAYVLDYPFEGGVKNIAKRDGLGIVLLEAVSTMGKLPDRYFQAVGSGTGAVAVWEMSNRFLRDSRFGSKLPVLHLAQNLPFAPMTKAWNNGNRNLAKEDLNPELIEQITTRVISNRYPAYSIHGGVYDALSATKGKMYGIENDEVFASMEMFEKTESIDIVPAAGVAVAALQEAVDKNHVDKNESILLNITGGGENRLRKDMEIHRVKPQFISKDISDKDIKELMCNLLKTD
jgi:cysteate synthase